MYIDDTKKAFQYFLGFGDMLSGVWCDDSFVQEQTQIELSYSHLDEIGFHFEGLSESQEPLHLWRI